MSTKTDRRAVVRTEEVLEVLEELHRYNEQRAEEVRSKQKGRVRRTVPNKADVRDSLEERLLASLEDEIVEATPTGKRGVDPSEVEREVIKKALVGLKSKRLKAIARAQHLEVGGDLEEIATRVGRRYRWDGPELARLILESDREPRAERSHIDRLFLLREAPDFDYVENRLNYVEDRYIRVGLARWFVFDGFTRHDDRIVVNGQMQSYRPSIPKGDDSTVIAVEAANRPVSMVMTDSRLLCVRNGFITESRAAMEALRIATKLPVEDGFEPILKDVPSGPAVTFAGPSLFLLDLIYTRLARANLRNRNLTVAKFKMDEATDDPDRPVVRSVRLEGSHILDSGAACRLMAIDGRAMVGASLTVSSAPRADGSTGTFPIQVVLERDHVLVMTGFGIEPELAGPTHRLVLEAAEDAMLNGLADAGAVGALADRILARANNPERVEQADMLSDEALENDE